MFEFFDHTADLGLRVRAADLPALFAEGGRALVSVIVSNPQAIASREVRSIRLQASGLDYLFFDWLQELLFLSETQHFLGRDFHVAVANGSLEARVSGEISDPLRHVPAHEVKAVTYHELKVMQQGAGWMAEVILDI
jgi:SHS2 domain-containing protein